jgi:hypothetical protein
MGGPAGSGGSDRSDEKKVDTYSDQLKKEQARKSKFKTNKFGYKVKKNIVERIVDNHPGIQIVKNIGDKMNLNRRMKFANKNNINIQGMSTEQILSKDFKSKLDAKGYTRKDPRTGNNEGGDNNQKSTEQPKVASQMDNTNVKSDLITADKTAPTTAEMENAELTDKERMLKVKRGRKTKTVLTSITGDNTKTTLSKKALLGG